MTQATLHTNHGAIGVELFDEDAPVVHWRPDEGGFFSRLFRR